MKRIISILLCTLWLAGTGCDRNPQAIFQAVFKQIPASVHLINGQDQYISDCCLWLHFTIAKPDLQKLLTDHYEQDNVDFDNWKQGVPPGMTWWKPEKLGDSARCYKKISEKEIESIYTNSQMTEVYYVNFLK